MASDRRTFLVGAGFGLTAGAASWLAAPDSWHQARLPAGTQLSFAQNGEDLVLEDVFESLRVERPSYLDIGAYHPSIGSNTYLFYRRGARGVLVEPNVEMVKLLKAERRGDVVINAGIGLGDETEADYFMMNWPQRNTFDREEAETVVRDSAGQVRLLKTIKMPLLNVNKVLDEHFGSRPLDLFSIDVEGLDLGVLRTVDFTRFRPLVICAEHSDRAGLYELLEGLNYELRGLTVPNSIFVDRNRG